MKSSSWCLSKSVGLAPEQVVEDLTNDVRKQGEQHQKDHETEGAEENHE